MDIDQLIESFSEISKLLNSANLQDQLKQDAEIGVKLKRLNKLVEEIKIQQEKIFLSEEEMSSNLEEINTILSHLGKYCDTNLAKLDFLNQLKPLN